MARPWSRSYHRVIFLVWSKNLLYSLSNGKLNGSTDFNEAHIDQSSIVNNYIGKSVQKNLGRFIHYT
jgi:hypothetical protein